MTGVTFRAGRAETWIFDTVTLITDEAEVTFMLKAWVRGARATNADLIMQADDA